MSISQNIKALRESHGMTQNEFGNIAGVSGKAVSTWELGIKEPRMGAIQKIADYFSIRKSDIIENAPSSKDKSAEISNDVLKLAKEFMELTPEQRNQASKFLAFLVSEQKPETD